MANEPYVLARRIKRVFDIKVYDAMASTKLMGLTLKSSPRKCPGFLTGLLELRLALHVEHESACPRRHSFSRLLIVFILKFVIIVN